MGTRGQEVTGFSPPFTTGEQQDWGVHGGLPTLGFPLPSWGCPQPFLLPWGSRRSPPPAPTAQLPLAQDMVSLTKQKERVPPCSLRAPSACPIPVCPFLSLPVLSPAFKAPLPLVVTSPLPGTWQLGPVDGEGLQHRMEAPQSIWGQEEVE